MKAKATVDMHQDNNVYLRKQEQTAQELLKQIEVKT